MVGWLDVRLRRIDGLLAHARRNVTPERSEHQILKERILQQVTISRLSRLVLGGGAEDQILDEAVRAIAEALHVEMATYLELSPHQDTFVLKAAVGWPPGLVGQVTIPAGDHRSYAGYVISEGHPVSVQDMNTDTRLTPTPLLTERGVVSGLSVVVYGEKNPLGVLGGHSRTARLFTEDEAEFLQTVANVVSVGVLRRRAEDDLQRREQEAIAGLRASEDRFRKLAQNSSDLIAIVNDKSELLYANPAGEAMLGLKPENYLGANMLDLFHPEDRKGAITAFLRDVSEPGVHPPSIYRLKSTTTDWRYLELIATNCLDDPAIAGIVINARDVTERTYLSRALSTLTQGNQVLVHAKEEASLLADTCRSVVASGGYLLAWVGYADQDEALTIRPVASAGCSDYLDDVHISWGDNELGGGPTGTAIRTGRPQVVKDMHRSKKFTPWRADADTYGLRTGCALPLRVGNQVIGALSIYAGEAGAFDPAEVAVLSQLADELSYGIGRLRDGEALAHSEARFYGLVQNSSDIIITLDAVGTITYGSPAAVRILGIDPIDALGTSAFDLVHPDDRDDTMAVFQETLEQPGPHAPHDLRARRADGSYVALETVCNNLLDDPSVRAVVLNARDVTERRRIERLIETEARLLDNIANGASLEHTLKEVATEMDRHVSDQSCLVVLTGDAAPILVAGERLASGVVRDLRRLDADADADAGAARAPGRSRRRQKIP